MVNVFLLKRSKKWPRRKKRNPTRSSSRGVELILGPHIMEIITERHKSPSEIVPATESASNIRDEANKRTCKAGYTDRDGQPIKRRTGGGKGDVFRPVNKKRYDENYDRIFGKE